MHTYFFERAHFLVIAAQLLAQSLILFGKPLDHFRCTGRDGSVVEVQKMFLLLRTGKQSSS